MPNPSSGVAIPPRVLAGDFAGWLTDAMAARRMSSRMLAVLSGIDHSTVFRLAAGDRQPTLGTAIRLFRVLAREPMILPPRVAPSQVVDRRERLTQRTG